MGTLPPPRFSIGEFKKGDVHFCYGSIDGLLWPVLEQVFNVTLLYETTKEAINQRKKLLATHNIGVCDIVEHAKRQKIDASDLGMQEAVLKDLLKIIKEHPLIDTLLFMGGNSKNGPEYFFRKLIKKEQITLEEITSVVPRQYKFSLPNSNRTINTVSLTSPSGSANRAIGSIELYKQLKKQNPKFNTIDFRVLQYRKHFKS